MEEQETTGVVSCLIREEGTWELVGERRKEGGRGRNGESSE